MLRKELGKEITVDVQNMRLHLSVPAKGKALAAAMYQNGVDIISSMLLVRLDKGSSKKQKDLNESGSGDKVWVIGVDRDQDADGKYTKQKTAKKTTSHVNFSTLKAVSAQRFKILPTVR